MNIWSFLALNMTAVLYPTKCQWLMLNPSSQPRLYS